MQIKKKSIIHAIVISTCALVMILGYTFYHNYFDTKIMKLSSFFKGTSEVTKVDYAAYNTNQFVYLSDINYDKEQSKVGWGKLTMNNNSDGDLISLIVNGTRTYFLKGIFAHANSTVLYDISKYNEQYAYFTSYVGVDASRFDNGNGVIIEIATSNDGQNWNSVIKTNALKGNTEAEFVKIPITGVNYLRLSANTRGDATADHAVYGNAKLVSENYEEEVVNVDYIKKVSEYDELLKGKSSKEILASDELTLYMLQRNFVKNVGYELLQVYAAGDEQTEETLKWLMNNLDVLKMYTTGGKPLGNYINSLQVLTRLYQAHKMDLHDPENKDLFQRMMIAISLTHSSKVAFWVAGQDGSQVLSDAVKRYEQFKDLYLKGLNGEVKFETDIFKSLSVEELRWVVDTQMSDEEIPWLNWYSSATQPIKSDGSHNELGTTKYSNRSSAHTSLNPYTYIAYYQGWNYYDPNYYSKNAQCGVDAKNRHEAGYSRTASCENEYQLSKWGVGTDTPNKPRLWIVMEEDGVCGALSKLGANLLAVYGYPTAVIGQPGHAAYLSPSKVYDVETGKYITKWNIGNAAAGWGASEKGERFPLNWGSKANGWHSYYNVSYIILIQDALDEFATYEDAMMMMLTADLHEEDYKTQENIMREALKIESFNLDAWYKLIKVYEHLNKSAEDYYSLALEITDNMKNYPLPMMDLLRLIEPHIAVIDKIKFNNLKRNTLQNIANITNERHPDFIKNYHPNYKVINEMANNLLGNNNDLKVASFSFTGEHANSIVLEGTFANNKSPFRYSLDNQKTWTNVIDGSTIVPLDAKELASLNAEDDIYIQIIGSADTAENRHVIDLHDATAPTGLYANDWENRLIGKTDNMEWCRENSTTWTKFDEDTPTFEGNQKVYVRYAHHDNYLPSPEVEFTFTTDLSIPEEQYVSIDRLSVYARSSANGSEVAENMIDGNIATMWHSNYNAAADTERYITIKVEDGIYLKKLEYLPRRSGLNGVIKNATIYVSEDGENWRVAVESTNWDYNNSMKTVTLMEPVFANYIMIKVNESYGNFVSGTMLNFFEDTTKKKPEVENPEDPEEPPVVGPDIPADDPNKGDIPSKDPSDKEEEPPADDPNDKPDDKPEDDDTEDPKPSEDPKPEDKPSDDTDDDSEDDKPEDKPSDDADDDSEDDKPEDKPNDKPDDDTEDEPSENPPSVEEKPEDKPSVNPTPVVPDSDKEEDTPTFDEEHNKPTSTTTTKPSTTTRPSTTKKTTTKKTTKNTATRSKKTSTTSSASTTTITTTNTSETTTTMPVVTKDKKDANNYIVIGVVTIVSCSLIASATYTLVKSQKNNEK